MKTPRGIDLDQYRTQAKDLLKSCRTGDPAALERLREHHPDHSKIVASGEIKLSHAQLVVARENGFSSWKNLREYLLFRQAVEALDQGDVPRLAGLLDEHPFLISYRCRHGEPYEQGYFAGATLLNHVAGNPFRVPLPSNIVDVARLLLARGAHDEEPRPRYTIGLLLTSKAASEAGVALPLIDLIVEKTGASIDFTDPQVLNGPLGNHAPATAEALIRRGAPQNVGHAAALGRFDLVRTLVEGLPLPPGVVPLGDRERDLQLAFIGACANNRTEVAEYLLDAGVDPAANAGTGQPGLHTAVYTGSLETVEMLLRRGAPMEIENEYGGTALGQALWSYENEPHRNFPAIIAALVRAGAVVKPGWTATVDSILRRESEDSIWRAGQAAIVAGDERALAQILDEHGTFLQEGTPPDYGGGGGLRPSYQGTAREIIVRENQFGSWEEFEAFDQERRRDGSPTARFEAAVEAIVEGDEKTLTRLIREDPSLVQARSSRVHRSTLLHYVGANGVESFHQKTPRNAVRIAKILLEAGSDVEAVAGLYGGSRTLGLVATSIFPLKAGVQNELIELLLEHGANVEESDNGSAVIDSLRNGRGDAAVLLAKRGAKINLEAAAGIGRLDIVKSYFDDQGRLQNGATERQMIDGFAWACEFARNKVIEFLLSTGLPIDTRLPHDGQIGLHWAANGGHVETARILLDHGSPVSTPDETYGGTPIDWAIYGLLDRPDREPLYEIGELLIKAGGTFDPRQFEDDKVAADPRLMAILQASRQ